MATSQDFVNWVCSDELDYEFLKYVLLSENRSFLRFASGTTHQTIYFPEVKAFHICLPPLAEQKAIAHILGTLDEKIELNRRMNETLEGIARAVFKSWFVDFDPVRAKLDGRKPPGMDAATAALFPDGFEETETGKVPRGWRVGKLGDVIRINERSIRKGEVEGEIQYIDIASVSVGRCEGPEVISFESAPSRARRKVRHGDTIWSCVRPNRRSFYQIHNPPANLLVSTGFAVLSPADIPAQYLYYYTTTLDFTDYLTYNADGSAYPAVRADHFAVADVLVPSPGILEAFEQVASPLRDRIAHNDEESQTLASLRDTLLPKLLSGEIRVAEAAEGGVRG